MTHDPLTIMQLRRSLAVTARILSEKDGTVEYIASDATLDSYQESILSSGWRFNRYAERAGAYFQRKGSTSTVSAPSPSIKTPS